MNTLTHPRIAAALLLAATLLSCTKSETGVTVAESGGPVIIISIDTLRADRLPAWGYRGVETPAIDSLVRDGIRFDSAWSHVPLTLPSHASIFTGKLPGVHGVRDNLGYQLPRDTPTLASILKGDGYATAGMASSWVLRGESGIATGFDLWDDEVDARPGTAVGELQRSGAVTADAAMRWVASRGGDEKFLLFVHLFEPHTPYSPPEPFRARYSDPYDGEIAAADAVVGEMLTSLRSSGLYDRAAIILLSDHGEGLGDHGEAEHGVFLYREALHVPLVVKLPASAMGGTTVEEAVQLIDVFPTVLHAAGVERPADTPGVSLIDVAAEKQGDRDRRIFSETMYPRIHYGWSELTSLTDGEIHVIQAPRPELYRLTDDPAEQVNRVESERRLYADFRKNIEALATPYAPPAPVDAEEAAKLSALGYLGAGPSGTEGPLPDPKDRIGELQQMHEAWKAMQNGRAGEAIRLYRSVLESNPLLADAWLQLATVYERTGQLEESVMASKQAARIAPSLAPGVALTIARLQLRLNDLDGAEQHAALGAETNPDEAKLIRGRIALAQRNYPRALELGSQLVGTDQYRAQAVVVMAQAHTGMREPQKALLLLEQERQRLVAAGLPFPSQFEFARADALVRLGRIPEGIAAFRSEIEHHPGDLDAYARLAVVLMLSGREADAERVMEALTSANPHPRSYALAADTFARMGREAAAERWRVRAATATLR